jgi:hypothetical protein
MACRKFRKARLSLGVLGTTTNGAPPGGISRPCLPFREKDQFFFNCCLTNSLISFIEQYFIAILPDD